MSDIEIRLQSVAFNIRKSRKDKRKSQGQVARSLKVSQNAYSKLECGKTQLTLKNLMIIGEYLNISIFDLLNQSHS